jgi:hypothetical protein
MPLRVKCIAHFYFHRLLFALFWKRNDKWTWVMASSFLFGGCGIGKIFIEPMGCEDVGAPGKCRGRRYWRRHFPCFLLSDPNYDHDGFNRLTVNGVGADVSLRALCTRRVKTRRIKERSYLPWFWYRGKSLWNVEHSLRQFITTTKSIRMMRIQISFGVTAFEVEIHWQGPESGTCNHVTAASDSVTERKVLHQMSDY